MTNKEISQYLQFLPALYQSGDIEFLNNLLLSFQGLLAGRKEGEELPKGLEEILDRFTNYLDPYLTPPQLLEWLAGWFALDLRKGEEWEGADRSELLAPEALQRFPLDTIRITRNRNVIGQLAPYSHQRGTKAGLEQALEVYLGPEAKEIKVNELVYPFRIGFDPNSIIGVETVVGEAAPYYFRVQMERSAPDNPVRVRKRKLVIADIIDQEKPAHTYYTLIIKVPAMKIGIHCTIGKDTLVGGITL